MKLLISGATGFIGKNLTERLFQENNSVYAIVRPSTKKSALHPHVKVYVFDGNINDLITFLETEKFDGIVHLASLFLGNHKSEDVTELVQSNVLFSTSLLEAATKSNTPWFINTGTYTQHYKNKKYSPVNLYSATKQAFESIAQYYIETASTVFVTIKLFDTFGPGDTRPKIINLWSNVIKTNSTLDMSPGEQIININYIDDVVDGYMRMITLLSKKDAKKNHGKTFIISASKNFTLKKLAKIFEKATKRTLTINWGGKPYREREVMVPWNKGEKIPGWKPKTSIEDAIKKTIGTDF
jgi:CDP-paratose synthetase